MEIELINADGITLKTKDKYCSEDIDITPKLQTKTTTVNGKVTPDENYIGLKEVTVNVRGGGELNIAYGDTAPEDTSKLWIKSEKPSNISFPIEWTPEQIAEEGGVTDTGAILPYASGGISTAIVGTDIYLANIPLSANDHRVAVFNPVSNTVRCLLKFIINNRTAAAAVGTKIYLFGGYGYSSAVNTIQVLDTTTETVQTLSVKLPTAGSSISSIAIGTKIYLFGGDGLDTIQVFDTTNDTIKLLSTKLSTKAPKIAAAAVGTKIYLFGGWNDNIYSDTIQVFDTTNDTIQTLSTKLPMGMYKVAAAAVGTKIYLFSGDGGQGHYYTDMIQVFDTTNDTIQTLSTKLPIKATGMAAAAVGTKIYLFGGHGEYGNFDKIYQFTDEVPLASNDIIVTQKDYSLTFTLLKPPTEVELGCKNVYKGDQSLAKFIDAYVYDGVNWVNVNTNDVTFTKLYAPTISISGKTLTITNDGRNGSHVTNYKVYNGNTLLTTVTATTLDLTTVITANGTYNISVIATGTGYTDSDSSNVVEYIYVAPQLPTPINLTVDGTIISWDAVENAESYDVYADDTALLGNTTGIMSYTITPTLTNVTAAGGNATTIATGETKVLTYTANSGYNLPDPDSVIVTGATRVWNKDAGTLTLSNPTGNVTFTIAGVKDSGIRVTANMNGLSGNITVYDGQSYSSAVNNYSVGNGETVIRIESGYIYIEGDNPNSYVSSGYFQGNPSVSGGVTIENWDPNGNSGGGTVVFKVTGPGTITCDFMCMIEGTQITLADGSTKAVENITYDDELLVWNFYAGRFDKAKPSWIKVEETAPRYNLVKFSNGSEVGFVGAGGEKGYHRIFNKEAGAFTYTGNFKETPNGTTTFAQDGTFPTVISQEVVEKEVKFYNVITDKHYNIFANGILTSCRLSNEYKIEDMKYVGERLITDKQIEDYFDKKNQNKKQ